MDPRAYEEYRAEALTWLRVGRRRLLETLVSQVAPAGRPLRLLEVGAGVGHNLDVLARFGRIEAIETDPIGLQDLRRRTDLARLYTDPVPFDLSESYDVIVAFDVLEHIADDRGAAAWIAAHLADGGHVIATVPAYGWLFSDHDRALEHHRRYTRRELVGLWPTDVRILRSGYFNSTLFPAAAASRLLPRLRRTRGAPAPRRQRARMPAPIDAVLRTVLDLEVRAIGAGLRPPFGLTAFCVGRRTSRPPVYDPDADRMKRTGGAAA